MIQFLIITMFVTTIILGISAIRYSLKIENNNMKYSKHEEINPAAINLR